jgi:pyruvate formate lyase activating enzyme
MKVFNELLNRKVLMAKPQNFSIHDGPGIRTVLFFSGCPLKCKWCANPECLEINDNNDYIRNYSVEEILNYLESQRIFYRQSDGGVTFSGGEATFQKEALDYLSVRLYNEGISMALETSAYFDYSELEHVLKRMDLIFVDLKTMDNKIHEEMTGKKNTLILKNIKILARQDMQIVIRIPVIEGVNATEENINKTAKFLSCHIKKAKIELLPYHTLGQYKYDRLGKLFDMKGFKTPSREKMKTLKDILLNEGLDVISYD